MKTISYFALMLCTIAAWGQQNSPPSTVASPGAATPGTPRQIFQENCARCHNSDGSSETFVGRRWNIPDLRSDAVQKLTVEQRIEIITHGKNKMPAHVNKLTTEEIRRVESYVRELGKAARIPAGK